MRFDPQTITVTDNKDRTYQIDALVAFQDDDTPVGLAIHPVYHLGPGSLTPNFSEYTLTHLASGVRLHRDPLPTEAMARRWLELVAPLTDGLEAAPRGAARPGHGALAGVGGLHPGQMGRRGRPRRVR